MATTEKMLSEEVRAGEGIARVLEEAGIVPNGEHAMEPIEEAVMALYKEMIASGALAEKAPEAESISA